MQLELTTWERVTLGQWLGSGQPKGDLAFVRRALSILDKLDLTERERAEVNYRRVGNVFRWDDTGRAFALSFNAQEMGILKSACTWQGWPATRQYLAMLEKLEAVKVP